MQEKQRVEGMVDSGARQQFTTGAVREPETGKGRFDLIEPELLFRLAVWYEKGAQTHSDRNWEKGIPVSRCVGSAFRHLAKYIAGWKDEDHLAAVVWNCAACMRFEKHLPEMCNLPWQVAEREVEANEKSLRSTSFWRKRRK